MDTLDYLMQPIATYRFKKMILDMIKARNSKVAVVFNHVLQSFGPCHKGGIQLIKSIRFLDLSDEGMLSFYPILKNKPQKGKIGRVIKSFLDPYQSIHGMHLNEHDIEIFVNEVKHYTKNDCLKFELVKGKDIAKYLHKSSHAKMGISMLSSSCMADDRCKGYFHLYETMPHCHLLILFDTKVSTTQIVGRALVWEYNGIMLVDRRYYTLECYHAAMIGYAKSQLWGFKAINTLTHNTSFMIPGTTGYHREYCNLRMPYDWDGKTDVPYLDTFRYYQSGYITNELDNIDLDRTYFEFNQSFGFPTIIKNSYICDGCGQEGFRHEEIMRIDSLNYCPGCIVSDYKEDVYPKQFCVQFLDIETVANSAFPKVKWMNKCEVEFKTVRIDGVYYSKDTCFVDPTDLTFEEIHHYLSMGYVLNDANFLYIPYE